MAFKRTEATQRRSYVSIAEVCTEELPQWTICSDCGCTSSV